MGQLLALLAVLAVPCPGDTNGDHRVTIAELVAAVNAALDGCGGAQATPTATPRPISPTPTTVAITGCPVRFTDDNTSDDAPSCWFGDHIPPTCEPGLRFFSDGHLAVLVTETPEGTIYYGGIVAEATRVDFIGKWTRDDLGDFTSLIGGMHLSDDGETFTDTVAAHYCGRVMASFTELRYPPRSDMRAMLVALSSH